MSLRIQNFKEDKKVVKPKKSPMLVRPRKKNKNDPIEGIIENEIIEKKKDEEKVKDIDEIDVSNSPIDIDRAGSIELSRIVKDLILDKDKMKEEIESLRLMIVELSKELEKLKEPKKTETKPIDPETRVKTISQKAWERITEERKKITEEERKIRSKELEIKLKKATETIQKDINADTRKIAEEFKLKNRKNSMELSELVKLMKSKPEKKETLADTIRPLYMMMPAQRYKDVKDFLNSIDIPQIMIRGLSWVTKDKLEILVNSLNADDIKNKLETLGFEIEEEDIMEEDTFLMQAKIRRLEKLIEKTINLGPLSWYKKELKALIVKTQDIMDKLEEIKARNKKQIEDTRNDSKDMEDIDCEDTDGSDKEKEDNEEEEEEEDSGEEEEEDSEKVMDRWITIKKK